MRSARSLYKASYLGLSEVCRDMLNDQVWIQCILSYNEYLLTVEVVGRVWRSLISHLFESGFLPLQNPIRIQK